MSMKETQPNKYKRLLAQHDRYIQARIDECKQQGKESYSVGLYLYPVFFDDICRLFNERGYATQVKFEHGWDQDFTDIVFTWKKE
jgi:hypothetical protein